MKARISSSRRATSASVGVCTRPSETAPSKAARRRIEAARVAFMPTTQSASERERAAASSDSISSPGRSCAEGLLDRLLGHRGQPQALDRLVHPRGLVDVGEDQLALAPGVAGVHDLSISASCISLWMAGSCFFGPLVVGDELELLGQDRQVGEAPLLQLRVVGVGLGQAHEVADRPGDHVLVAHEVGLVLRLLEGARQRRREVARHRRLLGDDEGLAHGLPFQGNRDVPSNSF